MSLRSGLHLSSATWLIAALLFDVSAHAQSARDPMKAPATAATESAQGGPAMPVVPESTSVVQRDGKPFLVVGTRLVGVGQTINGYRLDRITETEIWLREGKNVQKIARFSGIQRTPAVSCTPSSTPTEQKKPVKKSASRSKSATPTASPAPGGTPCESSPP